MGKRRVVRGPWGLSNKQFADSMRRLPSRLSPTQVEADRLTRELDATKRLLQQRRKAHMLLTPDQRREARSLFDLSAEAIDAHLESLQLQLDSLPVA